MQAWELERELGISKDKLNDVYILINKLRETVRFWEKSVLGKHGYSKSAYEVYQAKKEILEELEKALCLDLARTEAS